MSYEDRSMAEFRFLGVANTGKMVQGVIAADTSSEAKKKIKIINCKIGHLDRFEFNLSKIQKLAVS